MTRNENSCCRGRKQLHAEENAHLKRRNRDYRLALASCCQEAGVLLTTQFIGISCRALHWNVCFGVQGFGLRLSVAGFCCVVGTCF